MVFKKNAPQKVKKLSAVFSFFLFFCSSLGKVREIISEEVVTYLGILEFEHTNICDVFTVACKNLT